MTEPTTNAPWTLRRRVVALCLLLAVVLVFLAAGAAITAIANRDRLTTLLDDVGPMRAAASSLATDLLNQETAVRGFVLTADEADLAPYDRGRQDADVQVDLISRSGAATPVIRGQLSTVTSLASEWRITVAEPAVAAARRGERGVASTLLEDSGRQLFVRVRAAMRDLSTSIAAIGDDAVSSIRDTSSTLLFALIVVAIIALAAGVTLLVALQRTVIVPITHLAAQVRAVSRGNYAHEITTIGPPELRDLGHDIDVMRQQIASDLAEVRAARGQIEAANAILEQQATELIRSNRDLEQFAYVASHDLQEPLRKVASFCQLLQRRYQGQLDERADQYIDFAVTAAQRMQRLINDLLAFSRIGRNTAGFTDVNLDRVVAEAAGQVDAGKIDAGAADAGTEPIVVTRSGLPVVRGEETLLATLFTNLIGNALKFRRPDVPITIDVTARRVGGDWEISCTDNGIGIEPEYAEKIFVIFQRLHPRDAYPGTGIGLAVAKKIVEYHGGDIWLDTGRGPGTTIRFTLPAIEAAGHTRAVETLAAAATTIATPRDTLDNHRVAGASDRDLRAKEPAT